MLQILKRYHAGSRVDGPPQVTVAPSFLIILLQKSSGPLQVPISSPLLSCTVPSQISRLSHLRPDFTSTYCGVNVHLSQWQCLKCENDSRHFQPGEGPSRGLLRDCKTSRNLRFQALDGCWAASRGRAGAGLVRTSARHRTAHAPHTRRCTTALQPGYRTPCSVMCNV